MKFDYVLFRKAQSDPLEGRFGTDRQLAGGNYYAGTRQFLEAEKTIRIKSLIKYCNFSMAEIKCVFKEENDLQRKEIERDANALLETVVVSFRLGVEIQEDRGILYYVSGYIARCIKKSNDCVSCTCLVVKDESTLSVSIEDVSNESDRRYKKQFFDVINRGGLCKPSDVLYMTTVHAQQFFHGIFKGDSKIQTVCSR